MILDVSIQIQIYYKLFLLLYFFQYHMVQVNYFHNPLMQFSRCQEENYYKIQIIHLHLDRIFQMDQFYLHQRRNLYNLDGLLTQVLDHQLFLYRILNQTSTYGIQPICIFLLVLLFRSLSCSIWNTVELPLHLKKTLNRL